MNTKKWLALGLSVALAATAALAACAPTEPKEPDEGDQPTTPHTHTFTKWDYSDTEHWRVCPDDGELDVSSRAPHNVDRKTHTCKCGYEEPHTHSYTAWRYDTLQHWKVCPGDEAVDESTRELHNFVEGVCEDCGKKEPEVYVYGRSAEAFGYVGIWCSMGNIKMRKDKWVKMELDENGKYTADIYFVVGDTFAVADIASIPVRYPAVEDPDAATGALQIEEANTYTVTFDPADGSVTVAVHAHTYVWKYDADNHWKVCSTKDQAVDESSRGAHSYDQEGGKCVCGAVQTVSCDHSKGYSFNYTELPAAEADGGTLQKTCPDCHDTQDVTYSKGFTGDGNPAPMPGKVGDISEAGTYYFTTGNKLQTLGLKITEAGTYTLTFEEVCDLNYEGGQLGLYGLAFGNSYASNFMVTGCISMGNILKQAELTNYGVKVNEKDVAAKGDLAENLVTFSFTVTEEQLQAGDLYVTIQLGGYTNDNHGSVSAADSLSHLVTVKKD